MSRQCTVCTHGSRQIIDLALASNSGPIRTLTARFGLSKTSLLRHKSTHIRSAVTRAVDRREDLRAEHLLEQLRDLHQRTLVQLDRAEREKAKPAEVARVVKECRENLATMGKLLGAFPTGPGTLIDNRTQILNLEGLTIDELRSLASLADRDRRPLNGEPNSGSVEVTVSHESPILEQLTESQDDLSRLGNGVGNGDTETPASSSVR
jgi:hypothetical protein